MQLQLPQDHLPQEQGEESNLRRGARPTVRVAAQPLSYIPFLDGLRAVAILAVVTYHAFPAAMPGGYAGVDLFFVLSGYLITRLIVNDVVKGGFSVVGFLARRARRLLPAAAVMIIVTTVVGGFILMPDAYRFYGRSLMSAALAYANVYFYVNSGYFAPATHEQPLVHMWSLAVEDQFYLVWSVALLILAPWLSRRALVVLVALCAAASLALAAVLLPSDSDAAFYLLPTRAWELLAGAALALTGARLRLTPRLAELLAAAALMMLIATFVLLKPVAAGPGLLLVPLCAATVTLIALGEHAATRTHRLLASAPFVGIGLISYSLYLWHWPMLALATYQLQARPTAVQATTLLAASFLLAVLSWRYVEQPFRTRAIGRLRSEARFLVAAIGVMLALGSVGGILKATRGLPERYPPHLREILAQLGGGNPLRSHCDNYDNALINNERCNFGKPKAANASFDLAIFGDSMADHWVAMLMVHPALARLSGRQVTNGGCAALLEWKFGPTVPKFRECARYQRVIPKFLDANPQLKIAVLSAYWLKWQRLVDASGKGRFEEVLRATIAEFRRRGIKVHLIGPTPYFNSYPIQCVAREVAAYRDPSICGRNAAAVRAENAKLHALFAELGTEPGITVTFPIELMCGDKICPVAREGTLLFKDSGHLTPKGARSLAPFFKLPTP